jgi:phytoene synthase
MLAGPRSRTQLDAAYATCRAIARGAAANFYYAFLALPKAKRNAICAVYAFMRHADDIADNTGLPLQQRYQDLQDWLNRAKRVIAGEPTDDAVLLALADAQRRFKIPLERFEQLIQGTTMDLDLEQGVQSGGQGAAMLYDTFDQLYQYCFHVASVVGLACIRVFGYHDAAAEPLAEKCGIAFQLTNIIRDVREDAALGRVYLPREDMERFGRSTRELAAGNDHAAQAASFRPLLEFEAQRARDFYKSGRELLPLIDEDSRPALWVLINIYFRLLERIARRNYDVFSERVSLGRGEKLVFLLRGLFRRVVT